MALSPYPHLFEELDGAFTRTTQLYTQRRGNGLTPKNYRFTIEELALYIIAEFALIDMGDIWHLHEQTTPSTEWTINHNLNRPVGSARVKDASGNEVVGEVADVTVNQATITFTIAIAGEAIIH